MVNLNRKISLYASANNPTEISVSTTISNHNHEIDLAFEEAYKRVHNYTFDRTANPNISIPVVFTIDKLATLLSNPSYLEKYLLPGIYALLTEDGEPVYIQSHENMIVGVFQKLKEIQMLKKIVASENQQQRRLSFNNPIEKLLKDLQASPITAVKMEIFPKAKPSLLLRVASNVVKQLQPFLNKALTDYQLEIQRRLESSTKQSIGNPSAAYSMAPTTAPTSLPNSSDDKVSPFVNSQTENSKSSIGSLLELSKENVDRVLEEVRPYLIADGGNVEVVSVYPKDGRVELMLQGACGSCPSSTATMKLGIERVLKEHFPNLQSVVALNLEDKPKILTEAMITELLGKLLPTIEKLGGKIQIVSVNASTGSVFLKYQGPEKLRKGIDIILKENELVKEVVYQTP